MLYYLLIIYANNNKRRYIKVIIKKSSLYLIIFTAILSNTFVILLNKQYEQGYKYLNKLTTIRGVIVDNGTEKEYNIVYKLKIKEKKCKNKVVYLSINKKYKNLCYGDYIEATGNYIEPEIQRNKNGFNYKKYLKSKKILGTIRTEKIKLIKKEKINFVQMQCNKLKLKIINNINEMLDEKEANVLSGILIGEKAQIDENIIESFKKSNLSHILAISGMHINYIILGITILSKKQRISKRISYVIIIIFLIIFAIITDFSVSVIRAVIMSCIVIISKLLHMKVDIINTISISLLIILINNPFSIIDVGLELSYVGTIGIILFQKQIKSRLEKILNILNNKNIKKVIIKFLTVSISAQIAIIPIMAVYFNAFSISFLISSIIAIPIVEIILIYGLANIIISLFSMKISMIFAIPLKYLIKILIFISNFISKIPFLTLTVVTPSLIEIISYYSIIFIETYNFYIKNKPIYLLKRYEKNFIKKIEYRKIIYILCVVIIFCNFYIIFNNIVNNNLDIFFIDVGQGDCCLITTPNNKKIIIDSGDNKKDILVKYLLDKRIKTIDYIIISHFDSDHCNGFIDVLNRLSVKNVIIGKQYENTSEYEYIINIIKNKKIKLHIAETGQKIQIEKYIIIDIIWPFRAKANR